MKPLLVGQAPSRETDGRPPFTGRSGARLARLCGVAPEQLGDLFDLANLFDRWPGRAGGRKGDAFVLSLARDRAAALNLSGRSHVVLVGRNVAAAFGQARRPLLGWFKLRPGVSAAVIPHPSGLVRWWNHSWNEQRAKRFLRDTLTACRTAA